MNFSRTVFVDFISRFGRAGISLAVVAVFVRELGIGVFGIFVLFEAVLTVAGIFVDFGIGSAVQKRVAEYQRSPVISTALLLKVVLVCGVSVVVLLFRADLNAYLGAPLALYVPVAVGVQQLGRVGLHALRGELRVSEASVIQFLGDGVFLCTGYWFVLEGQGVIGLVHGFLIGWSLILIGSLASLKYSPSLPTQDIVRSLFNFSKYSFISSIIGGALYSWMDSLVIGYFLSSSAVGLYESAWRVSRIVSLMSVSVGAALFPQVSDWHASQKMDEIRQIVRSSLTVALSAVFPTIVGAWLFGSQILLVAFGPETTAATVPLIILLFGKVFEATNDIVGRALYGLNLPRYTAYSALIFVFINLTLNVVLVSQIGIIGAAIATSMAFAVNASLNAHFLKRSIDYRPAWQDLSYCAAASLWMGLCLAIVARFVNADSAVALIAIVVTGVLLYTLGLLAVPSIRRKFRILATQFIG